MRLQILQIKNFISIKQATVNFEDLNDGVFLISGPTGSGKSSLLDAVHWVLFGKTLSSNRASVSKEIRSTYAPANEDTVVSLTFNQDKIDYKVIRTLKRDGGTAVQLFAPGIIYDKVKEANEHLEKIIGLTVKQFDQMVMLEQGNFSKFLLADSRTRAEILRDIFDTQLFKDIEIKFKDRCTNLKNTILNSTELEQSLLQGEMLETVESAIILTAETIRNEQARLVELKKSQQNAQEMLPDLVAYDRELAVYQKAQRELQQLEQLKTEVELLYKKRDVFTDYVGVIDWYDRHVQIKQDLDTARAEAEDYRRRIAGVVVDEGLSTTVAELQQRQVELDKILADFAQIAQCEHQIELMESELVKMKQMLDESSAIVAKEEATQMTLTERLAKRQEYEAAKSEVLKRTKDRDTLQSRIQELTEYIQSNRKVYSNLLTKRLLEVSEPGVCPICGAPFTGTHTIEDAGQAVDEFAEKQKQLETLTSYLNDMPELPEPILEEICTVLELTKQLKESSTRLQYAKTDIDVVKSQQSAHEGSLRTIRAEYDRLKQSVAGKDRKQIQKEADEVKARYSELWSKVDENEMAKRSRNLLEGYLSSVLNRISHIDETLDGSMRHPEALPEDDERLKMALAHRDDILDYRKNINTYLFKIQQYEMLRDNLLSVSEPVNPHPGHTASSCKQLIYDTTISIEECIRLISDYQGSLEARRDLVKRVQDLRAVREKDSRKYDEHVYLYNLLSGKNNSKISFETFVLHRQLEWILQSSNQYLYNLSAGQFELQVKWESASGRTQGGLEITITDHFTGSTRPAQTYSGGELFMLSLSLSLGLMTAIDSMFTARDLNLLFVDEGFGTLDSDCLNRTLMTLRDLKNIKSVGIISHVQDLIDTIPQGYIVEKTATGSKIKLFKNI